MEDNVWVFVCTHGRFGEELMKSAEMIAGEAENVFAFSLMPGMQPEDYRAMLEKQLEKLGDGKVLCLVDRSVWRNTVYDMCDSVKNI